MLPSIGPEGVNKIRSSSVMIVGCGALGSMCAMQLAASGVGKIGIADFDTIEISNLQRQLFFSESQLGEYKSKILSERIKSLNSDIVLEEYPFLLTYDKCKKIFPQYDFIIDGSDNPSTKGMVARVCEELQIGYCIGGVKEFSGQVFSWLPGHTRYSDLFGDVSNSCSDFLPCSIIGVLGSVAGVVASIQSAEAIKMFTSSGDLLLDRLFTIDILRNQSKIYHFKEKN